MVECSKAAKTQVLVRMLLSYQPVLGMRKVYLGTLLLLKKLQGLCSLQPSLGSLQPSLGCLCPQQMLVKLKMVGTCQPRTSLQQLKLQWQLHQQILQTVSHHAAENQTHQDTSAHAGDV